MTLKKEELTLADFDFNLPKELIAQTPTTNKSSKLLEVKANAYKDYTIDDLYHLINPNDLLVVNNTKVIKSRFLAKKGDRTFVITLHKALANGNWLAFTTKVKKLQTGDTLELIHNNTLQIVNKNLSGELEVAFNGTMSLDDFLDNYGF